MVAGVREPGACRRVDRRRPSGRRGDASTRRARRPRGRHPSHGARRRSGRSRRMAGGRGDRCPCRRERCRPEVRTRKAWTCHAQLVGSSSGNAHGYRSRSAFQSTSTPGISSPSGNGAQPSHRGTTSNDPKRERLVRHPASLSGTQDSMSSGSSTSLSVRRSGSSAVQVGSSIDDGRDRREEVPQAPPAGFEERTRSLGRRSGAEHTRERPLRASVGERDGDDARLAGRHGASPGAPRVEDPACPRPRGRPIPRSRPPALPTARGAAPHLRSHPARTPPMPGRHRGLLRVGRKHDDHAIAHLEQTRDRMLEERAAPVLLRELVATEPAGSPSREHDPRDVATVPGRRVSLGSARRRTRNGP